MDADLDQLVTELKARCARLAPEDQKAVLDGWTQVLTLWELPRKPGETVALSISLDRSSEVTYLSG